MSGLGFGLAIAPHWAIFSWESSCNASIDTEANWPQPSDHIGRRFLFEKTVATLLETVKTQFFSASYGHGFSLQNRNPASHGCCSLDRGSAERLESTLNFPGSARVGGYSG